MANTGLLRDWLWFWTNGKNSAKNTANLEKASTLNLTIKEAKDNYYLKEEYIDSSLPPNEMIAHDSIKFKRMAGGFNGTVNCIVNGYRGVYVGGDFNEVNGRPCSNLVKLIHPNDIDPTPGSQQSHPKTHADTTFNTGSGFNGPVKTIDVMFSTDSNGFRNGDHRIFIGGEFTMYNGTPCNYFVCLDKYGKIWSDFNLGSGFNWFVNKIMIDPLNETSAVYAVGSFVTFRGINCPYIVKLTDKGEIHGDYRNENFPGPILDINYFFQDSLVRVHSLLLCGSFSFTSNGKSFNNFAITNMNGKISINSSLTPWVFNGPIHSVMAPKLYNSQGSAYYATSFILTGNFSTCNNWQRNGICIIGSNGFDSNSRPTFSSSYTLQGNCAIQETLGGSRILYGGSFETVSIDSGNGVENLYGVNNIMSTMYYKTSSTTVTGHKIGDYGVWGGSVNTMLDWGGFLYIGGSIRETIDSTKTGNITIIKRVTDSSTINGYYYMIDQYVSDILNPDNQ